MVDKRFRIHIFTVEDHYENESSILGMFLNAGLDALHIRKPNWSKERIANLLEQLPKEHLHKVVLHSYPELAMEFGTGIQLNSKIRSLSCAPKVISRSCHSLHEVEESESMSFVTLSPVFCSISKQGYNPHYDFCNINLKHIPTKVIALGGVTLESLPQLINAGFAGAAFLGAVWQKDDGINRMIKFLLMRNFRLQFITNGTDIQTTLQQARMALDGGCRWIQVRMKHADNGEVRETLQELKPWCDSSGATLIADDRVELVKYCHGVHLGQNDMPVHKARQLLPAEAIIGLTVNNAEQIEVSRASLPDYYGIGPYRFTTTKKNLAPVLGLDGYNKLKPMLERPFVAIGGILFEDLPAIMQTGASGVAVSSALTQTNDPIETTKKFINYLYK